MTRLAILALLLTACTHSGGPGPHPAGHTWSEGAYEVHTRDGEHSFTLYVADDALAVGGTDLHAKWELISTGTTRAPRWYYGGAMQTSYGTMRVYLLGQGQVWVRLPGVARVLEAEAMKGDG